MRVEAFFGELFRGPAAGDSGANNDRVIVCCRHGFPLRISRPGPKRRAAMLRTGDDFELQFLRKTDFRCVVGVKSQVFEYRKEIALHLPVAAFGFPGGRRLLLQGAGVADASSIARKRTSCCAGEAEAKSLPKSALLCLSTSARPSRKLRRSSSLAHSARMTSMNSLTRAPLAPGVAVAGMIWSIMATTVSF